MKLQEEKLSEKERRVSSDCLDIETSNGMIMYEKYQNVEVWNN